MRLRAVVAIGALAPASFLAAPPAQAAQAYDCGTAAVNCGVVRFSHTTGTCTQVGDTQECTAGTFEADVYAAAWVETGSYTVAIEDYTAAGRCAEPPPVTKAWTGPSALVSTTLTMACDAFTEPWYTCARGQKAKVTVTWTGGATRGRPTTLTAYDSYGEHCVL